MNSLGFGGIGNNESLESILGQPESGGFGQAGFMQQGLANAIYTASTTTAMNPGTTLSFGPFGQGAPLPPAASPADPPEIIWLKGRIDEMCWKP